MHICSVCTDPATLKCSGCESFYYCSKKCQKKAWGDHKFICGDVSKDKSFKNLQKTKFKCFVCKKAGFFLTRNSCCGVQIHYECAKGGFCPKCGDFCGFNDDAPKEVYPRDFEELGFKKMMMFSATLASKGLKLEELLLM